MNRAKSGESAVFYRNPRDEYPMLVRAAGCRLWDDRGVELIDLTSGISGAALIGQGNEIVAQAMVDQISRISYAHTTGATTPAQEELALRLAALAPNGVNKVMTSRAATRSDGLGTNESGSGLPAAKSADRP